MGVAVRKDIEQALHLNKTTLTNKKKVLEQSNKGRSKLFVDSANLERNFTNKNRFNDWRYIPSRRK